MNKVMKARQLRRAVQLWAASLEDESVIMEVAGVYPQWEPERRAYRSGDIVSFGVNAEGEPQLYRAVQDHVSQKDWSPDASPSLFKKIGFDQKGEAIWTRPLCAEDAYSAGDRAVHKGSLWTSDIDGNVWEPGVYGWTVKGA